MLICNVGSKITNYLSEACFEGPDSQCPASIRPISSRSGAIVALSSYDSCTLLIHAGAVTPECFGSIVPRQLPGTPSTEKFHPMAKTLVDCGNCGPDFNAIRQMVTSHFDAAVLQTHGAEDTIELLKKREVDLVTVNRKLDRDYTDGLDVIKQIKSDPDLAKVPVMLVTNYDEHQEAAMNEGAERGFGKLEIGSDKTIEQLKPYLVD